MEQNVKKEVEGLKQMARNWKKGFTRWVEEDGTPEFAQREFRDDMSIHLLPYLGRLIELKHLTSTEAGEVVDYFQAQCDSLGEQKPYQPQDRMMKSL